MALINIYLDLSNEQLEKVLNPILNKHLQPIIIKLTKIQKTMAEFNQDVIDKLNQIDEATTQSGVVIAQVATTLQEVSSDQKYLINQLATQTLTEAQKTEILNRLSDTVDKGNQNTALLTSQAAFLTQIAADVDQPVPEGGGDGEGTVGEETGGEGTVGEGGTFLQ